MTTYNDIIPKLQQLTENEVTAWGYLLFDIIGKRIDTTKHSYTHIVSIMATPEEMEEAYNRLIKL